MFLPILKMIKYKFMSSLMIAKFLDHLDFDVIFGEMMFLDMKIPFLSLKLLLKVA